MRYHEESQCQLECDLLNKRGGLQYSPTEIMAAPWREKLEVSMWTPEFDGQLTTQYLRRTMFHKK